MRQGTLVRPTTAGTVALLVTLVAGAGPALADPPHTPVRVAATSAHDGSAEKAVTVQCPGSTFVFAAGGGVGGEAAGTGHVALTAVIPAGDLRSATVRAVARGGHTGSWSLLAQVICEASGSPLHRVAASAAGPSHATATCGDGTKAFGAGFRITGDPDHVFVTELAPDEDLTRVRVRAGGDQPPAEVTAYAICRSQAGAMRRVAATAAGGERWPSTATVADTADAHVYGVGGRAGGNSRAFLDAVALRPGAAGGAVRAVLAGAPQQPATAHVAKGDGDEETVVYGILIGSFH